MNVTAIEVLPDCERVYVYGATVSLLATLLDSQVPWVWILGHHPNHYTQWWKTTVPINSRGATFTGAVRSACLDIQMPTMDFVSRAREFDDHGLVLIQSRNRMPDTLCVERIADSQLRSVLTQNGATLRIYLPHPIETALVECYTPGYLATTLNVS